MIEGDIRRLAAGAWAVLKFLRGKPSTIVKASADRGGIPFSFGARQQVLHLICESSASP
jgi:hypothetical protein